MFIRVRKISNTMHMFKSLGFGIQFGDIDG